MFNIATPLPCTEMLKIALDKEYLPKGQDQDGLEYCGFGRGSMTTEEFTPMELQVLRAFEWDRINFTTPEKARKIANILGISPGELQQLRRDTRRQLGLMSVPMEN